MAVIKCLPPKICPMPTLFGLGALQLCHRTVLFISQFKSSSFKHCLMLIFHFQIITISAHTAANTQQYYYPLPHTHPPRTHSIAVRQDV